MQFNLNSSGAKHSISLHITKGSKEKKREDWKTWQEEKVF